MWQAAITEAAKALLLRAHPDRNPTALAGNDKAREILNAGAVLKAALRGA